MRGVWIRHMEGSTRDTLVTLQLLWPLLSQEMGYTGFELKHGLWGLMCLSPLWSFPFSSWHRLVYSFFTLQFGLYWEPEVFHRKRKCIFDGMVWLYRWSFEENTTNGSEVAAMTEVLFWWKTTKIVNPWGMEIMCLRPKWKKKNGIKTLQDLATGH